MLALHLVNGEEVGKCPQNRDCEKDIVEVKTTLNAIERLTDANIMVVYEKFRYLRNLCVNCQKNQTIILLNGVLPVFVKVVEKLLHPGLILSDRDHQMKTKIMCVQFLGNLVVRNDTAQKAVWKIGFPTLYFDLMSNLNERGKDYLCMVMFNCIKDRDHLFAKENEFWLMTCIIDHCISYEESEWGLFVLQLVVKATNFVDLYKRLIDYPQYRSFLLDLFCTELEGGATISEDSLLYLATNFETKSACVMLLACEENEEYQRESLLLCKTLSLLCEAMSNTQCSLRGNMALLKCTIGLLKNVGNCDTRSSAVFKRDLIRLIGNMCYRNKAAQDEIRHSGVISAILNGCNIDDDNLFLMQWSVFATRNICEGNALNQAAVKEFERQGMVSNDLLTDVGVNIKIVDGKITLVPEPPS